MFTKLDSQSLCIYLELISMKGIGKSIILQFGPKILGLKEKMFKTEWTVQKTVQKTDISGP